MNQTAPISGTLELSLDIEEDGIRVDPPGVLIPWDKWDSFVAYANRRRARADAMAELREKMP